MEKSLHTRKYRRLLRLLRRARKKARLTQIDVGEKLKAYKTYVSKCEAGERRIDVIEFMEFCKVYGVPWSKILRIVEKTEENQ